MFWFGSVWFCNYRLNGETTFHCFIEKHCNHGSVYADTGVLTSPSPSLFSEMIFHYRKYSPLLYKCSLAKPQGGGCVALFCKDEWGGKSKARGGGA